MSSKSLYLALLVIAVSLTTAALGWLIIAPWRLGRILSEVGSGAIEPLTAVVFGGPLVAGGAAAIVRLLGRQRRPATGAPAVGDGAA